MQYSTYNTHLSKAARLGEQVVNDVGRKDADALLVGEFLRLARDIDVEGEDHRELLLLRLQHCHALEDVLFVDGGSLWLDEKGEIA